ncbi:hypothetical protein [Hymenobacter sp. BRD67]|uniref:hypothetical protein n=1 Tax=Hymenobacter sp. BRD67 TaxID=2675877 RepID=UPI0020B849FA|nr:hypothetical protein [Hymenobacter sp. BRD67]
MLTTLTLFTLRPGAGVARWALAQMATAPRHLQQVAGLRFFQLLGSGAANGFGFWPNLRRYGLLATWQQADAAAAFFAGHPVWAAYAQHSAEIWTVELAPLQAHGTWDGLNPFDYAPAPAPGRAEAKKPVAVLTRASIRLRRAPRFWRYVEPTSRALAGPKACGWQSGWASCRWCARPPSASGSRRRPCSSTPTAMRTTARLFSSRAAKAGIGRSYSPVFGC